MDFCNSALRRSGCQELMTSCTQEYDAICTVSAMARNPFIISTDTAPEIKWLFHEHANYTTACVGQSLWLRFREKIVHFTRINCLVAEISPFRIPL